MLGRDDLPPGFLVDGKGSHLSLLGVRRAWCSESSVSLCSCLHVGIGVECKTVGEHLIQGTASVRKLDQPDPPLREGGGGGEGVVPVQGPLTHPAP